MLADRLKVQFEANESGMTVEQSSESEQALTEQVKEGEIDSFLTLALRRYEYDSSKFYINECYGIQSSDDAPGCAPIDSNGIESGRVIIVRRTSADVVRADSI